MTGQAAPQFPDESRDVDFFDGKGAVESLLEALGVPDWQLGPPPSRRLFHPGRSASIVTGGVLLGEVGEVHPRIARALDLADRVVIAEFEVAIIDERATGRTVLREISPYPPVRRDLAFVVDARVPAGAVRAAILDAAGGLAENIELFSVFAGPPIPEGRKSLAFSVDFRVPDRTLTSEEADEAVQRIRQRLERDFNAELRTG